MIMKSALILSLLFLVSSNSYSFSEKTFKADISKAMKVYNDYTSKEETKRLFVQGKVSESNAQLKSLVSDDAKTFYDYFILSNLLFKADKETSYQYMKKAEEFDPDNPYLLFERGIHEHRNGNYQVAANYYQKFQKSNDGKNHPVTSAYLTHAYLMMNDLEESFKSWSKADFGSNHTGIEKGMYTLFSSSNQDSDRETLISSINAGDTYQLCNLFELDSNWEIDWWNSRPKENYLAYDSKLAEKTLKKGSLNEQYFKFCSSGKKLSDTDYLNRLKALGILDGQKQLPESSALTYNILKRLMSSKLMTPLNFLNQFESQIKKYAEKSPNDTKYYDILAFLYASTDNREKLKSVDRYGWKTLKLEKYASSYVVGIDLKSELFSQYLNEALADFPLSVALNKFNLSVQTKNKKEAMVKFVASQFPNVKNNWAGRYRLSDYMNSLSHEINKLDE